MVDHLTVFHRAGGSDRIDNCVIVQAILADQMTAENPHGRNYAAVLKLSETGKAWI